MGRWQFSFIARNPENPEDDTWEVGVAENHYRQICNHGHEKAQARLVLVKEVLDHTLSIYRGWCRPDKDDCFVYVGQPKDDWHKMRPEIIVPAPPGMVFLVFVLSDGTVDDWCWRKHADNDVGSPDGVTGELIWQRQETN